MIIIRPRLRSIASALLATCTALALSACSRPLLGPDYGPTPPVELPPVTAANGSIYQEGRDVALFENAVARRVGDILTIRLTESTSATKSATTTTSKSTSATIPGPTIAGRPVTKNGTEILNMGIGNESEFSGAGSSKQSNALTGDITVTVAKRFGNGNLLVRGEKWLTLNQGREFVRIQGIVRPIDIAPDNTIASSKVADASIAYAGKGALADSNTMSWLARFFNSPKLPF